MGTLNCLPPPRLRRLAQPPCKRPQALFPVWTSVAHSLHEEPHAVEKRSPSRIGADAAEEDLATRALARVDTFLPPLCVDPSSPARGSTMAETEGTAAWLEQAHFVSGVQGGEDL